MQGGKNKGPRAKENGEIMMRKTVYFNWFSAAGERELGRLERETVATIPVGLERIHIQRSPPSSLTFALLTCRHFIFQLEGRGRGTGRGGGGGGLRQSMTWSCKGIYDSWWFQPEMTYWKGYSIIVWIIITLSVSPPWLETAKIVACYLYNAKEMAERH